MSARKILIAAAVSGSLALAGCGSSTTSTSTTSSTSTSAPVAHHATIPALTAHAAVAQFRDKVAAHTFWTVDCLAGKCSNNDVGAHALDLLKLVPHGEQRYDAYAGIANTEFKLLDAERLGDTDGDKQAVPRLFADECRLVDYPAYRYSTCVKTTNRFLSHYHLAG